MAYWPGQKVLNHLNKTALPNIIACYFLLDPFSSSQTTALARDRCLGIEL